MSVNFPSDFPSEEVLINTLQEIQNCSWLIKNFNILSIEQWLSNFSGAVFPKEDERRIALWLLANYTYYNDKEIDHLCSNLYKRFIHSFAVEHELDQYSLLKEMKDFCYIPLGKASESGGFIAYQFRKQAKIGTNSSTQANNYIQSFKESHDVKEIYLLTLVATDNSITELRSNGINVVSCIELDDRNKCFSEKSIVFYKFPSILTPAKTMAEHYGKQLYDKYPLGYKDGQFLFGFYYNVPNNTLPIFWSNKNWSPIFERKEKYPYDERIRRTFERYI